MIQITIVTPEDLMGKANEYVKKNGLSEFDGETFSEAHYESEAGNFAVASGLIPLEMYERLIGLSAKEPEWEYDVDYVDEVWDNLFVEIQPPYVAADYEGKVVMFVDTNTQDAISLMGIKRKYYGDAEPIEEVWEDLSDG